jgi:hypothetical protein
MLRLSWRIYQQQQAVLGNKGQQASAAAASATAVTAVTVTLTVTVMMTVTVNATATATATAAAHSNRKLAQKDCCSTAAQATSQQKQSWRHCRKSDLST